MGEQKSGHMKKKSCYKNYFEGKRFIQTRKLEDVVIFLFAVIKIIQECLFQKILSTLKCITPLIIREM
jgi:hypothetical protein